MSEKYVYSFGDGQADGAAEMKPLLGGKGANLAEMSKIGLPVPAGFTLSTDVCTYYYANDRQYPPELKGQVEEALAAAEKVMGAKFGDAENPLLLSCRSGARESMPGMMDTVLNIGINETVVNALIKQSGNEHFAWDSYRRLIQMYGDVVLGLKPEKKTDPDHFEDILDKAREEAGAEHEKDLSVDTLKNIVTQFKAVIKEHAKVDFPDDPMEQLWGCIGAVFGSWMNDRAIVYRRQYGIPHEWGTATNVQAMVFGNLGDDCATGVGLTRNCSDGTPGFCGDYLINAQGEDVVAGTRTPKRVELTLAQDAPEAHAQLNNIGKTLEQHYKDVQDIEFTVQRGKVWMLQTRNAKRTGLRRRADCRRPGQRRPDRRRRPLSKSAAFPPTTSTSCSSLSSTRPPSPPPNPKTGCSPKASTPVPARPPARSCSTRPTPKTSSRKPKKPARPTNCNSSSSAAKPARKTSEA